MVIEYSLRDEAEARVVIVGVVAHLGRTGLVPATNDPPGPPIAGPWCRHRVLAVEAPLPIRQQSLTIAKHNAVLCVRKRPARLDGPMGLLSFGRQDRQRDDLILCRSPGFGFGTGKRYRDYRRRCQDRNPPAPAKLSPRGTGPTHGFSLKFEAVMLPKPLQKLKTMPKFSAGFVVFPIKEASANSERKPSETKFSSS